MREGRPLASERFGTRLEAQDAATSAFVLAIQLQPTNGQIWFDLGTSLFFAGELDTGRPSSPSERPPRPILMASLIACRRVGRGISRLRGGRPE